MEGERKREGEARMKDRSERRETDEGYIHTFSTLA